MAAIFVRSRFVSAATSDASCTVITPMPYVPASDLITTYGRSEIPYSRYFFAIFLSTPSIASASASSPVRSWKSTPSTCAKYGLIIHGSISTIFANFFATSS